MSRARNRSEFRSVADIARRTSFSFGDAGALRDLELAGAWRRAVGEPLSAVSVPSALREGRLVVKLAELKWQAELERHQEGILGRLNQELGSRRKPVRALTFVVDPCIEVRTRGPAGEGSIRPEAADRRTGSPGDSPPTTSDLQARLAGVAERYLRPRR